VLTVDELLYNKVEIILHRHDEAGRAVQEEQVLAGDVITVTIDGKSHVVKDGPLDNPVEFSAKEAAAKFNEAIKMAETITVQSGAQRYTRDNETGAIRLQLTSPPPARGRAREGVAASNITELGLGVLNVKAKVAKSSGEEILKVEVTLGPLKEKDTETTAYASDAKANEKIIGDFLATWVKEPFERVAGGVKVGCEINFNKQFPKQSEVRPVKELLRKLHKLNTQSAELEAAFDASMGVTNTDKMTKLMMSTLSLPTTLPTAPQPSPIPGRGGKRIATRGSH
jgi:type I restriction enzyme M protein